MSININWKYEILKIKYAIEQKYHNQWFIVNAESFHKIILACFEYNESKEVKMKLKENNLNKDKYE